MNKESKEKKNSVDICMIYKMFNIRVFRSKNCKGIFTRVNSSKFPLAPMGVLAPGSAHARPSPRPHIDTSGNFPAHMSAESPSNISPNPSEVISEVSEP